jgi:hypothetical protein
LAACLALAGLLVSGCASPYWGNRGRDAKDVMTLSVGLGLGARARVGPLQVPLLVQSDYAGLRCGEWFASPMRDDFWTYVSHAGHVIDQPLPVYVSDYDVLYSGYEIFDPGGDAALRHKCENTLGMGLATVTSDRKNWAYYTNVEGVVGAIVSLRVGFNPGELVDWLVGFTGIDLMGDDVEGGGK